MKPEMTREEITKALAALNVDDVMQVYSGKPGCACGCKGNYRIHPLHLAAADQDRGYPHEAADVNLAQVKRVVNVLKTFADVAEFFGTGFSLNVNENGRPCDRKDASRTYAIYPIKYA